MKFNIYIVIFGKNNKKGDFTMQNRIFLVIPAVFVIYALPAAGQQDIAGHWRSVDFVQHVEDFEPGEKFCKGDLFLKEFECSNNGDTSLGCRCANGWTIHSDGKTQYRYFLSKIDGVEYLFLPWLSGDVTQRGRKPSYDVLKRAQSRNNLPDATVSRAPVGLHEDLRQIILRRKGKDLTRLDLSTVDLTKTTFDSFTQWPPTERLPKGFDPVKIMERGKYPGLGVKQLHNQGITGKGVHVAIIDQPLIPDHIEYQDRLSSYIKIQTGKAGPQMHGPAVASLLVGKTCGVAPAAYLHYWAEPSWKRDYQYRCAALEQIIEYNKEKTPSERIRVVSVSKGFSRDEPNLDRWKDLLDEAKRNGIYVIHCSKNMFGVRCPG